MLESHYLNVLYKCADLRYHASRMTREFFIAFSKGVASRPSIPGLKFTSLTSSCVHLEIASSSISGI